MTDQHTPVLIAAAQRAVDRWRRWWGEWLVWRRDMKGNDPARFHIIHIICVFRGHRLVSYSPTDLWCMRCHITRQASPGRGE